MKMLMRERSGEDRFHSDFPDCGSLNKAQIQFLGMCVCVCV